MSWSRGTSTASWAEIGDPGTLTPVAVFFFSLFPTFPKTSTHRRVYIPIDAHHHRLRHSAPRLQGNRALALAITLAITLA